MNSNNALPLQNTAQVGLPGGNTIPVFFSSVLYPDLVNRWLTKPSSIFSIEDFSRGLKFGVISWEIVLPFQNLMLKFRNRVHFLAYFLLFEVLAQQTPRVETIKSKLEAASLRNKRERRKAQDAVQFKGFRLNARLQSTAALHNLLNFFYLFVTPNTSVSNTPPSRLVKVNIEPSLSVISFSLKSLNIASLGFVADELSAIRLKLDFKLYPLIQYNNSKVLVNERGPLVFFAHALGVTDYWFSEEKRLAASRDVLVNVRSSGVGTV